MDFVISASATEQDLAEARKLIIEQHDPSKHEAIPAGRVLVLARRKAAQLRSWGPAATRYDRAASRRNQSIGSLL